MTLQYLAGSVQLESGSSLLRRPQSVPLLDAYNGASQPEKEVKRRKGA